MNMALHYVFSMRFRPITRQSSLWTWRTRFYRSASAILCDGNSQATHGNGCSHLPFKYRNPQAQSQHMFCSSAPGNNTDVKKFNVIYKFPGIRICKVVSRLKLLQTMLTVTALPPLYYYYLQGQVSAVTVSYVTGIAVFALTMLYCITYFLQRIIGMIYINQEATTLKISHLTFWGKRKDIYLPIEDVKKLSETGDHKGEVIFQLKRYSSPDILYLTVGFGQILDKEKFFLIFGKVK